MCGRFAPVQTRADYLDVLASELEVASAQDNVPIGRYIAAIGRYHLDEVIPPDDDGFVIVTAASDSGLLDLHDRRPSVLPPAAAREWMDPETTTERTHDLATKADMPPDDFAWHPVDKSVGNISNDKADLIRPLPNP